MEEERAYTYICWMSARGQRGSGIDSIVRTLYCRLMKVIWMLCSPQWTCIWLCHWEVNAIKAAKGESD
jgi:hypothetical protein